MFHRPAEGLARHSTDSSVVFHDDLVYPIDVHITSSAFHRTRTSVNSSEYCRRQRYKECWRKLVASWTVTSSGLLRQASSSSSSISSIPISNSEEGPVEDEEPTMAVVEFM